MNVLVKTCPACGEEKAADQFGERSRGGLRSWCRKCSRDKARESQDGASRKSGVLSITAEVAGECGHPYCDTEWGEGEQVFPSRKRPDLYCTKECRGKHTKILAQKKRRDTPESNAHDNFNRRFRKYGITREEFESMYDLQLGRCAICQLPFSETRVHVDHCHDTGEVRGLLCNLCNPGLGYFQDRPELLIKAAKYLSEHMSTSTHTSGEVRGGDSD